MFTDIELILVEPSQPKSKRKVRKCTVHFKSPKVFREVLKIQTDKEKEQEAEDKGQLHLDPITAFLGIQEFFSGAIFF